MKKSLIILLILAGILILPIVINMSINEIALNGFSNQLYNFELPKAATKISEYNNVGQLTNERKCGFVARIEVDFRLGEDVLNNYFKNTTFKSAYGKKPVKAEIIPKNMIDGIDGKSVYKRRTDGKFIGGNEIYYIQIYDDGYPKLLDLRCYGLFNFTKSFLGRQF